MAKLPASLFNDVIGPVMRGPSSSHVAGAARIGTLVRQSLGGDVRSVLVEFDVNGSLAESYHGHGSDIGFVSGLFVDVYRASHRDGFISEFHLTLNVFACREMKLVDSGFCGNACDIIFIYSASGE